MTRPADGASACPIYFAREEIKERKIGILTFPSDPKQALMHEYILGLCAWGLKHMLQVKHKINSFPEVVPLRGMVEWEATLCPTISMQTPVDFLAMKALF